MSDQDEGQHQLNPRTPPSVQGDEDIESPTTDDDVGEMVEEVAGEEPKPGETFTDIVNRAEKERRKPSNDTATE